MFVNEPRFPKDVGGSVLDLQKVKQSRLLLGAFSWVARACFSMFAAGACRKGKASVVLNHGSPRKGDECGPCVLLPWAEQPGVPSAGAVSFSLPSLFQHRLSGVVTKAVFRQAA